MALREAPPSVLPDISPARGEIGGGAAATDRLPLLVRKAAAALAAAGSAAEVLAARDSATVAYDAAKLAGRLAKAKGAHDELVATAHRAQADALEIEALAKRRLADEYDAAQERGEVATGRPKSLPDGNTSATARDVGLSGKEIFEARQIRDAIARDPGVVRRVLDEVLDSGDEPTKARLKREIVGVAREVRFEKQAESHARRLRLAAEKACGAAPMPERKYALVYADPPWLFASHSDVTGREKSPENHYPTMPTEAIAALPCPAADTSVLFMWALNAMLSEAMAVMAAWGFEYKSNWCWNKVYPGKRHGTGFWSFSCHELLLIGTRGKFPAPLPGTQPRSVFTLPVGRHSEKPREFAETLERLYPDLPRLEMFCRTPRPGWDGWGNEVGFVEGASA